jgi:hypothetical protein
MTFRTKRRPRVRLLSHTALLLVAVLPAAFGACSSSVQGLKPRPDGSHADSAAIPFQGEWYSAEYQYAFRIQGRQGTATLSNAPTYKVGDVMLHIQRIDGQAFTGEQIYTSGTYVPVTAVLVTRDSLRMTDRDATWMMVRRESRTSTGTDASASNVTVAQPADTAVLYTLTDASAIPARASADRRTITLRRRAGFLMFRGGTMSVGVPAIKARIWADSIDYFIAQAERGAAHSCGTEHSLVSGPSLSDAEIATTAPERRSFVFISCGSRRVPASRTVAARGGRFYSVELGTADGSSHSVEITDPKMIRAFTAAVRKETDN